MPAQDETLITFSKVDQAWPTSRGAGVRVAVIDWQFDMGRRARQKYVLPTSVVPGEEIGAMQPWHGEWMAKIVHAVAPDARIIPINARTLKQRDYQAFLVQGIRYAADHGALAVTSSMGPAIQSGALRAAIDYAHERGTIFVNVHPERIVTGDGTRPCGAKECDPRILRAGIVSVPEHTVSPDPARDLYTWPYDLEPHFKDGWRLVGRDDRTTTDHGIETFTYVAGDADVMASWMGRRNLQRSRRLIGTSVLRLAPPAYFSTGREGNIPTVGSEPQDIQPSSRAWSGTRLASCVKAVRLHDAIIALHLLNRYSAKERKHWSHVAA